MSRQAFDSTKELALVLPESERAELASALVASLDGPPDPRCCTGVGSGDLATD